ncbi:MAG: hypothetical protein HC828_12390 [Blastochloris sp.]|nr:hypothetical protein [Blastochloris sp.]
MSKGRSIPKDAAAPDEIRLYDRVQAAWGIGEMPVIVADEIARQIDALPDDPNWTPPASDYGVVAPPFKRWFVEATTLPGAGFSLVQRGCLCYEVRRSDTALMEKLISRPHRKVMPPATHWIIAVWGYFWAADQRILRTFSGPMFVHLDKEGYILDDLARIYMEALGNTPLVFAPPEVAEGLHLGFDPLPQAMLANFGPFNFKALAALHQRCPVDHVKPSSAQRRRAQKREQLALHDYYVLKVKPARTQTLSDFRRIGEPEKAVRREHIVRGHFRYYTEERPLFGRVSGAVWVPEHERGDDQVGAIRKDYEVKE